MCEDMRKYFVEFIGTFFLVFTVGSAVLLADSGVISALSIGFILMVMVYAGGHISGGHYNPAVSLAVAIRGGLPFKNLFPYWIFQIFGGVLAAWLISFFVMEPVLLSGCDYTFVQLIVGEFLFTFALCYVVLQTATTEYLEGNSFYGLAIGSTVTVGIFAVGGIFCFAAFNPAVAVGLGILHIACWFNVCLTVLTNLFAGLCAAFTYKYLTNTKS